MPRSSRTSRPASTQPADQLRRRQQPFVDVRPAGDPAQQLRPPQQRQPRSPAPRRRVEQQQPARPQHPRHLAQHRPEVVDVLEHVGRDDGVHGAAPERQPRRVARRVRDPHPARRGVPPPYPERGQRGVDAEHRAAALRERLGHEPAPAPDVEYDRPPPLGQLAMQHLGEVADANGVELVQRRDWPARIPPAVAEAVVPAVVDGRGASMPAATPRRARHPGRYPGRYPGQHPGHQGAVGRSAPAATAAAPAPRAGAPTA